jgi:predicted nucleic acid-binding protein
MIYVVDAYSWIDYFDGNTAGQKVKVHIENPANEIITNILNLAEISSFLKRRNTEKTEEVFNVLFSISKIYNFDSEFSKNAGLLHAEIRKRIKDFGLIDAFVLLTARKLKAKIITGDEHFRNIKETILIK